MNKYFFLSVLVLVIFTGCSSRQYYEPKDTYSLKNDSHDLNTSIIDLNSDGATLENSTFLSKKGIIANTKKNYKFLNFIDNTSLSSDLNSTIYVKNKTIDKVIKFEKNIISATVRKNILAFGSIDNSITLYNLNTQQVIFKEYLKSSTVNNVKIANPIFLNTVVIFPTLDGKIVIVDLQKNTIARTINIDPRSDINNIIFLKELNDTLIAATSKKLFSFVNGKVNLKDIDIQSIIVNDHYIYIATLDGEIVKYDFSLRKIASKKFKFAKINALAFGTSLYALESQEFLIRIINCKLRFCMYNFLCYIANY